MVQKPRKRHQSKFKVSNLLENIAIQMAAALSQNLIHHPGELGTGREEIVRDFLRKYLPKKFDVATGFVFDIHGNTSKQVDVIVYEVSTNPVFEVSGGKKLFPCESVVCVGEIKSVLTSKQDIQKAFENLRSVKELDRGAGENSFSIASGELLDPKVNHLDQIFSFLWITDKCVSEEHMRISLFEYLYKNERHLWPNLCFYYDHYLLTYYCEDGVCPNAMDAYAIASVPSATPGNLLLHFYRLLARAVNVISVGSFSYWDYLDGPDGFQDTYAFPFSEAPIVGELPEHMLKRIMNE
ncbi:MAG: hypothetical protein L6461_15590 [Anaerolineae bacterium]|jgi:hypothetical protein|nr:hypothetical protein [Anaerolineae bacterium]